MSDVAVAHSPFAKAAPELMELGFHAIPVMSADAGVPGAGKAPGTWAGGKWRGLARWQRFCNERLSGFELGLAMRAPDANVGICLGSPAGQGPDGEVLRVIAVDLDCSGDDLDTLQRVLKRSPMTRVGRVGEARLYRAPASIVSQSFDRPATESSKAKRLVDLLAHGRQVVLPGSIHPMTGAPYRWIGGGPCRPEDLPIFDSDDLQQLLEALECIGWSPAPSRAPQVDPRCPRDAGSYANDWDEANGEGLARLGEWFPLLNLPKTRQVRAGVWCAVPKWRGSGSGRPTEQRKPNLSASSGVGGTPAGVRDWGASTPDDRLTAIDLVSKALELEPSEALGWLRSTLALDDDAPVIDLASFVASCQQKGPATTPTRAEVVAEAGPVVDATEKAAEDVQHTPAPRTTHGAPSAEFPPDLLDCPGLVSDLADWMTRTAQRPLPAANLLTALSVVGTIAGRRFCGPTEAGTVLYGLALAPSGSGKDHPRRAAQHVMRVAGFGHMIAPATWMSGSALVQHLGRQPACVSYADEVGEFFAKLNGAKASPHERAISGTLRELFGVNFGSFQTPGWADSNSRSTTPPVIHAPAYSFIGYSVPEAVWDAMQGADVTNGMLNRFILLPTVQAGVENDDPESVFDVSPDLIARLKDLGAVGGALAAATMHNDMASEPLVRVPWEGGKDGLARALFIELREHCREHPAGEHLMKRTAEIAVRLATIRAIGRDLGKAVVTLADMDWGRNVALWSAERMIADADSYMSETEWQQKALGVLRIIREAPGGFITQTGLYRRLNHKYKPADVKALLDGLCEAGQVERNSVRTGERGPPSITYRAA